MLVLPYGLETGALLAQAQRAGVRRVVFLSSGAVVECADEQPDVMAAYHARVEEQIKASGQKWTFVRLMFPAINALAWGVQLKGDDVVRGPYAGASASVVHERDVAEAVVSVLGAPGHAGRAYELTGPQSLTQSDHLAVLGATLGRELSMEEVPDVPVRQQLSQFMDGDSVNALFDLMAAAVGNPATVNDTIERLTGHPARAFDEWAADHAADFR